MICIAENCSNMLYSNNTHGYCRKHRHFRRNPALPTEKPICGACGTSTRRDAFLGLCQKCLQLDSQRKHSLYPEKPERVIERALKWAKENPIKYKENHKRWKKNHPEQAVKDGHNRRSRLLDAFVENVDPSALWCRDAGLCFMCGYPAEKNRWHLGHVIPLSRGGEHSYSNTAVYHPECNLKQGSRLLQEMEE